MTHTIAFDLPSTGTEHPPVFSGTDECRAWLAAVPLTNPVQAQAQLLRQLTLASRYTLTATQRIEINELLREPIAFVQEETAKKFTGKLLPLAPPEQSAFDAHDALWHALLTGYLHCIAACAAGDATALPHAALACQRALLAL